MDEQMFGAWQSGDEEACRRFWEAIVRRNWTFTVLFCERLDAANPEETATEAFTKAWSEFEGVSLSAKPRKRPIVPVKLRVRWQGWPPLERYVRNRVANRCRDALRKERLYHARFVELIASESGDGDD